MDKGGKEEMITYYHGLHQLELFKVEAQLDLDSGQRFKLMFQFTDGHVFVCQAIAEPTMRDHRTGDWRSIVTLGIGKDVDLTVPFKQTLKDHVKDLTSEVLFLLTGEW
jgi:hypothetical protein